jgi:hypothetical protein
MTLVQYKENILSMIRAEHYPESRTNNKADQKAFFRDRQAILRAITWPGEYCRGHGLFLPMRRIQELVIEQLIDIRTKGNASKIEYFPRYLLHCLQTRFKKHRDEYYLETKHRDTGIDCVLAGIESKKARKSAQKSALEGDPQDETERLADLHRALLSPVRKKKAVVSVTQTDLFGPQQVQKKF